MRASGEIQTLAHWMRNFVQNHSDYEQNSYVKDNIIYDLLKCVSFINFFFLLTLKTNKTIL